MRWTYYSTSDTTLSIGFSTKSDTGPWSFDGTFTTSNSLGSGGGFTATNPTLIYVDGDMWYQRYIWYDLCPGYTDQVATAVADSVEGSNSPPKNPYGGCAPGDSPYGYAEIDPSNGSFDTDRATAWGYSNDATVWGWSFSGQTGFSDSVHHHYEYNNPGGGITAICGGGSGLMPNSRILYSSGY